MSHYDEQTMLMFNILSYNPLVPAPPEFAEIQFFKILAVNYWNRSSNFKRQPWLNVYAQFFTLSVIFV